MIYTPAIKLTRHPQYTRFLENKQGSYIINMEISPSGKCKAGCKWCFYRNNLSNEMINAYKCHQAIREMVTCGCKAITWSGGGDPTSHPDLPKLIEDNTDIKHGLFTNALYRCDIKPEHLEWVRITWTPQLTVEQILQYSFVGKVGMVVNYSGDDKMLKAALKLAEETELDYLHVRPALGTKGNTVNIKPPSITHPLLQYQGYKFSDAGIKHQYSKCMGYHFVPFISENGNVYVCNYMTTDDYKIGSIYERGISEIMQAANKSFPVIDTCQVCCKNHEINSLLNFAVNAKDVDFV